MKKAVRSVAAVILASAITLGTPEFVHTVGGISYSVAYAATSPNAPKTSVKAGTYTAYKPLEVTLSCDTKGAKIYYKLGSGNYKEYTEPVQITKNATLYYYSQNNGVKSKVQSAKYNLTLQVDILAPTGRYPTTVTFSTPLEGVTYYYTTDGSKPTKKSKKVTNNQITLKKSCTLRVLAVKSGWSSKYYTKKVTAEKLDYVDGYLKDYKKKFYYNQLNADEKAVYEKIYNAYMNFEEEIDFHGLNLTLEKGSTIAYMVMGDNPQIFWLGGYSTLFYTDSKTNRKIFSGIRASYHLSGKTAKKRTAELEKLAAQVVERAKQEPTVYMCAKYFHDYIALNTHYDNSFRETGEKSAFFARADNQLLDGRGACGGYSTAFAYLCQTAGIPCIEVGGTMLGGGHAWNKVKIGDNWYIVDVTNDDQGDKDPKYVWFCATEEDAGGIFEYSSVLTEVMKKCAANSTKYTYNNAMGIPVYDSADEFAYMGFKLVADGLKNGETDFDLYYKKGLKDEALAIFLESNRDILRSYGIFANAAKWGFYDNQAHIRFNRDKTVDEVVNNSILSAVTSGAEIFTVCYEPGVMKGIGDINEFLISRGIIVKSAKAVINDTCAAFTVKYYDNLDDLKKNGLAKVRAASDKGVTEFRLCFTESLYKEVSTNLFSMLTSNGIICRTISGLAKETYFRFTLKPYNDGENLYNNGMNNAAKSFKNGVDNVVMLYDKGLKSAIDGKALSSLNQNGVFVKTVSGYVGDERTRLSVVPFETADEVTKAIPAVAKTAKGGQKEIVIWYKNGLKNSVRENLTADFVKLMKNNGAIVSVKSWKFTDEYVIINLA